jgi:Na+-driven multidrug efflux pump
MDDPNQVAAATLAMPPFVMLTGIANLFGIGGASLISRSLGEGNREKARRCAAFSIYTAAAVAFVYGFSMYLFRPIIFPLLGADAATYDFCSDYVLWTIAIGGIPTVMNACLAHLVRAEGYSKEASIGVALGGILNIILDPILIFPMQLGVKGAAIATMLSNLIATCYFLVLLYKNSDHTVIKFSPRNYTLRDGIPKEILLVAEAQAAGITKVAEALNGKGGIESVNMQLAQQYLTQFGNLAKQNNSMIVPADLANVAGILQACTSIIKKA